MDVKKVVGGLTVVVVAALGGLGLVVAMQPATLQVERSILVDATPADLFPLANDFRNFNRWDPWSPRDATQVTTVSDNPAGVGASMSWKGETNGSGRMTITASDPNVRVVEDLEFFEPFASQGVVTMAFEPQGNQTKVTWTMDSPNSFMGKFAGLFMDMQGMLNQDYDEGLAKLKTVGETIAAERIAAEAQAKAEAEQQAVDSADTETEADTETADPG